MGGKIEADLYLVFFEEAMFLPGQLLERGDNSVLLHDVHLVGDISDFLFHTTDRRRAHMVDADSNKFDTQFPSYTQMTEDPIILLSDKPDRFTIRSECKYIPKPKDGDLGGYIVQVLHGNCRSDRSYSEAIHKKSMEGREVPIMSGYRPTKDIEKQTRKIEMHYKWDALSAFDGKPIDATQAAHNGRIYPEKSSPKTSKIPGWGSPIGEPSSTWTRNAQKSTGGVAPTYASIYKLPK